MAVHMASKLLTFLLSMRDLPWCVSVRRNSKMGLNTDLEANRRPDRYLRTRYQQQLKLRCAVLLPDASDA